MHRFPQGSGFYLRITHDETKCLHVVIWLAICSHRLCRMNDTCSSTYCPRNRILISSFLSFDPKIRIKTNGAKPIVGIIQLRPFGIISHLRIGRSPMHPDSRHISQQFLIHFLNMLMMSQMVLQNGHLSTPNTCANITQPVIVSDCLMLIVWIRLSRLSGIPQNFILGLFFRPFR